MLSSSLSQKMFLLNYCIFEQDAVGWNVPLLTLFWCLAKLGVVQLQYKVVASLLALFNHGLSWARQMVPLILCFRDLRTCKITWSKVMQFLCKVTYKTVLFSDVSCETSTCSLQHALSHCISSSKQGLSPFLCISGGMYCLPGANWLLHQCATLL